VSAGSHDEERRQDGAGGSLRGGSRGDAVAVISKVPRLGRSKTRLARTLGKPAALALHQAFLEDELSQLDRPDDWSLYLVHDAPEDESEQRQIEGMIEGRAASVVPGGGGLGDDLLGAFQVLLRDHDRAIIVSGDVPHIDPALVQDALQSLDSNDLVLGPNPDGGYYLVGLRAPHDLFTSVRMSRGAVAKSTIALARSQGLTATVAPMLTDLDEAQDLDALGTVGPHLAQHTRARLDCAVREPVVARLPTELQVEVTSRCNLLCSACLRTHEPLGPDADLTVEQFREITDPLPSLGRVAFQLNGEPLMCAGVFDMIRHAVARGAHTVLNTNGTLLDARRRKELLDCGLHELRVSLDGTDARTVQRMTGANILSSVTEGVAQLVRERGTQTRPTVSFWMIATRDGVKELPGLIQLAADLGVDEVYLQRLVLTGKGVASSEDSIHRTTDPDVLQALADAEARASETGVALRASGRKTVWESLGIGASAERQVATPETDATDATNATETPAGAHRACWRPWRSAVVTASGKVLPCCISSFTLPYADLSLGDLRLGDLGEEGWAEIWNGDRYQALRAALLTDTPPESCRDCGKLWSL
jgi:rSAM/selenodomain-associated transferase 1